MSQKYWPDLTESVRVGSVRIGSLVGCGVALRGLVSRPYSSKYSLALRSCKVGTFPCFSFSAASAEFMAS